MNNLSRRINYTCPYCGGELSILWTWGDTRWQQAIRHDSEDGGCDGTFVLEIEVKQTAEPFCFSLEVLLGTHDIPSLAPTQEQIDLAKGILISEKMSGE